MNINEFLEHIKKFSIDVQNSILSGIINTYQASASVEKNILSQITNEIDKIKMESVVAKKNDSMLLNNFAAGKTTTVTEEYRKRFNLIIEKAEEFDKRINNNAIKIDEFGNFIFDKENIFLTESQYKEKLDSGIHKNRENIILSIENKIIALNDNLGYEISHGIVETKYFYPIILSGKYFEGIEKYITQIIVRETDSNKLFDVEIYTNWDVKKINQSNADTNIQHNTIILNDKKKNTTETYIFKLQTILETNIYDNRYLYKAKYSLC